MKVSDSLTGAVMLALALIVMWHVSDFPPAPGQPYGSALFPMLASGGLAVASLILMIQGLRSRSTPTVDDPDNAGSKDLIPVLVVLTTMGLYIAVVDWLGFIIAGTLMLAVLFAVFRVKPLWVLPIALLATLAIHTGFYRLLRVPLPWGLLQPYAW